MAIADFFTFSGFPFGEMNTTVNTEPVVEKQKESKSVREAVSVVVIDTVTQKVLMVQSKKKKDTFVLPRDNCAEFEDPKTAALRLLNEKAGVTIDSIENQIGTFKDVNKKGRITANHYLYEVHDITFLDNWKDSNKRQRVWLSYGDALKATEKKRWSRFALQKSSLARKMPVVA